MCFYLASIYRWRFVGGNQAVRSRRSSLHETRVQQGNQYFFMIILISRFLGFKAYLIVAYRCIRDGRDRLINRRETDRYKRMWKDLETVKETVKKGEKKPDTAHKGQWPHLFSGFLVLPIPDGQISGSQVQRAVTGKFLGLGGRPSTPQKAYRAGDLPSFTDSNNVVASDRFAGWYGIGTNALLTDLEPCRVWRIDNHLNLVTLSVAVHSYTWSRCSVLGSNSISNIFASLSADKNNSGRLTAAGMTRYFSVINVLNHPWAP